MGDKKVSNITSVKLNYIFNSLNVTNIFSNFNNSSIKHELYDVAVRLKEKGR